MLSCSSGKKYPININKELNKEKSYLRFNSWKLKIKRLNSHYLGLFSCKTRSIFFFQNFIIAIVWSLFLKGLKKSNLFNFIISFLVMLRKGFLMIVSIMLIRVLFSLFLTPPPFCVCLVWIKKSGISLSSFLSHL